jgi:hypothetical protein
VGYKNTVKNIDALLQSGYRSLTHAMFTCPRAFLIAGWVPVPESIQPKRRSHGNKDIAAGK